MQSFNTKATCKYTRRGMTLVELLAAIGIVGVLSSILIAVTSNVRDSAAASEETSAARHAVTAFLMTPMDNQGAYMPGYKEVSGQTFTDSSGRPLHNASEDAKRFPWRLAPYLEHHIGSLYVGSHQDYFKSDPGPYGLSLYPSLGMNSLFVGGHYDGTSSAPNYEPGRRSSFEGYPRDMWVLRPGDAYKPSQMIVFISAHSVSDEHPDGVGFFRVNPPKAPGKPGWGSYNEDIPASMGNVHLRHNDKAVVAHLDGSVALLNEEELKDMRRWSNQAAKFNDEDFSNWQQK